jgi:hypothetical protein
MFDPVELLLFELGVVVLLHEAKTIENEDAMSITNIPLLIFFLSFIFVLTLGNKNKLTEHKFRQDEMKEHHLNG